jgi:hypothetical protein
MNIEKTDSWLIASPGRSGSFLVSFYISATYYIHNKPLQAIDNQTAKTLQEIPVGHVIHTHETSFSFPLSKNTKNIIVCRNPIDCALSFIIQPKIGLWHLNKYTLPDTPIKPFYLNPLDFLSKYGQVLNWYKAVPNELLSTAKIIDYNTFSDDVVSRLPPLLDLPSMNRDQWNRFTPVMKNPGPHNLWIKNWDRIESLINPIKEENDIFYENFLIGKHL